MAQNRGGLGSGRAVDADGTEAGEDDADGEEEEAEGRLAVDDRFVFFRLPPPTGMFRRAPPLVQYLLQFLQK